MDRQSSWLTRLTATRGIAAVLLVRLYVGLVFACEGILKFLRPDALGTGASTGPVSPRPASLPLSMASSKSPAVY